MSEENKEILNLLTNCKDIFKSIIYALSQKLSGDKENDYEISEHIRFFSNVIHKDMLAISKDIHHGTLDQNTLGLIEILTEKVREKFDAVNAESMNKDSVLNNFINICELIKKELRK